MNTELRQARNVALAIGIGLLLLILGAFFFGQSESDIVNQSVSIGNDTTLALLPDTSLKTIGEEFWRYTDERLEFAIDIPKTMFYYGLACEKDADGYYNLTEGRSHVRVFQNENSVRIAPQYSYMLQDEIAFIHSEGYIARRFADCQKIENISSQLEQHYMGWEIISREVNNEEELELFLKQYYGEGCSLGELTESEQENVLNVSISGDGLDLAETRCPINQVIYTKYSSEAKRAVTWSAGQEATYWAAGPEERQGEDGAGPGHHDQRMAESMEIFSPPQ